MLVRHSWHILAGLVFPVASYFAPRLLLLSGLGAITLTFLLAEGLRMWRADINRYFLSRFSFVLKESESRNLTGSTYFLLGSLLTFVIFPQVAAAAALIYTAVADPAAAVVGRRWGRRRLKSGKSLEGSLAFLATALAVGVILGPTGLPLRAAAAGAVVAALVEVLPTRLDDNLSVPLASAAVMALLL